MYRFVVARLGETDGMGYVAPTKYDGFSNLCLTP